MVRRILLRTHAIIVTDHPTDHPDGSLDSLHMVVRMVERDPRDHRKMVVRENQKTAKMEDPRRW